jgi:tRNA-splicing ligase RtcB
MAAVPIDADVAILEHERAAAAVLSRLYELVPANKHPQLRTLPESLHPGALSDQRLQRMAMRDGCVQLGTLGRGNHFLEFQADQHGRMWVTVHSGSRGVGQAIARWHVERSGATPDGLQRIDAGSDGGRSYLNDVAWARHYSAENRLAMLAAIGGALRDRLGVHVDWAGVIHSDHNHVQQEEHHGATLWVHRKGAQSARVDELGIVPGSMGSVTFHTAGRGCAEALESCAHGAGRALSRDEARRRISEKDFRRQVGNVWYDHRRAAKLRDEAPAAYKDIRQVMKAQRELVRIVRELRPVLTYKGV